jgi:nicotinamidase-related amidase
MTAGGTDGLSALVIQECQQRIIGPDSLLPLLARTTPPRSPTSRGWPTERVPRAFRSSTPWPRRGPTGTASRGTRRCTRIAARSGRPLLAGTPAAEVIAEIGLDERDLVITRAGGFGPMYDTGLESLLRNLGVRTVVIAGVSVNVGILDLVLDRVNTGFEVVVPRDAVAGVPPAVPRGAAPC